MRQSELKLGNYRDLILSAMRKGWLVQFRENEQGLPEIVIIDTKNPERTAATWVTEDSELFDTILASFETLAIRFEQRVDEAGAGA